MPRQVNAHKAERIAQILFETTLPGGRDYDVAARHGISYRTLKRLRRQEADGELPLVTQLVQEKRGEAKIISKASIEKTIDALIDAIWRAATTANVKDPEVIRSLAGAYKLLTEAQLANKVLDARVVGPNPGAPKADRPMVTEGPGASPPPVH